MGRSDPLPFIRSNEVHARDQRRFVDPRRGDVKAVQKGGCSGEM
jgi:hypothetical protein